MSKHRTTSASPRSRNGARGRQGTTLIEVMMASLLLMLLALGGAAFLAYSQAGALAQQSKRVNMEAANGRLEALVAAGYDAVRPPAKDYDVYYLSWTGSGWAHWNGDPGEQVDVDGRTVHMRTTVRHRDVDAGSPSFDYLHLTVQAESHSNGTDRVALETYLSS